MTVINYFEEHLLNNFLLTGNRRYSENANVECYKHTIHPNSITASAMISLTFTNSFFCLSVSIHYAKKQQQNLCLPQFFKMSKQLVIHKPKEFQFTNIMLRNNERKKNEKEILFIVKIFFFSSLHPHFKKKINICDVCIANLFIYDQFM